MEYRLSLQNIIKTFPGVVAVNKASLNIKKGEIFLTLLYKIISKTPEIRPKKYDPESPK